MPLPFVNFRQLSAQDVGSGLGEPGDLLKALDQIAQTRQTTIQNQYLPQGLQEQLKQMQIQNALQGAKVPYAGQMAKTDVDKAIADLLFKKQENDWYGRKAKAEVGASQASTRLNQLKAILGEKTLPYEVQQAQFKAEHPFSERTGLAGDLEALAYMKGRPEMYGDIFKKPSSMQPQQQAQASGQSAQPSAPQGFGQQAFSMMPPALQKILGAQQQAPAQQSQLQQSLPQQEENLDPTSLIMKNYSTDLRRKQAYANLAEQKTKYGEWDRLRPENKALYLSQSRGMGIDESQALDNFSKGITTKDIAKQKGIDPNNIPVDMAPTMRTLNNIQQANVAASQLASLEPEVTQWTAPYSERFNGISPKLIAEMTKAKTPAEADKAGKALAGFLFQQEFAGERGRISNLSVGIHMLDELTQSAYGKINTLKISPNSEVYKSLNKWIAYGVEKMRKAGMKSMGNYLEQNEQDINKQQNIQDTFNQSTNDFSLEDLEAERARRSGGGS